MSWIGALLNTWRLESKTWFAVLLLLGIFNFGFFAMIAYLIAGPDGTASSARLGTQAPSQPDDAGWPLMAVARPVRGVRSPAMQGASMADTARWPARRS